MRYDRRLQTVSRQLGLACPRHDALLVCACHPPEPLPEHLEAGLDVLVTAIVARIGREAGRAACLRVPLPLTFDACPRCGVRRRCLACAERHTKALLREIGLTAAEKAMVETMQETLQE
jgi:hypothetical protein